MSFRHLQFCSGACTLPVHATPCCLVLCALQLQEVVVEEDDGLEEDFKAEAISAETSVLGEDGKPMPLPVKAH